MHAHELPGLDGGNLLGFLAALGTLRVLSLESSDTPTNQSAPALSWREHGGVWMPVLHHPALATREELLGELVRRCCRHEPTKLREHLEIADRRLAAQKEESKAALAGSKGAAKKAAKERMEAEREVLKKESAEARRAWEDVENEFAARRARRNTLKEKSEEAAGRIEKLVKNAPATPKKTEPALEDPARAAWQAELDILRREAAVARREWLDAVAALVPAPAFSLGDNLTVTPAEFADYARRAADDARPGARDWADYAAAFGSELYPTDFGVIQDTFFRTMSGAGHQHFLGTMVKLQEETTPDDLSRALFEPWDYSDAGLSLRWDAADDRRYALRFYDPGNTGASPILTVRGANRLAVEALPLFPTVMVKDRLATTGFSRFERDTAITWPVWLPPLGTDPVRSMLGLAELREEKPSHEKFAARGISQVYRARRFREGKFVNFSPAGELL